MVSRNKRDAKFLIFQSLYIIAIAILFYKGTDLSLNKVEEKDPTKVSIDSNLRPYDPSIQTILEKLPDNAQYIDVSSNETVVRRDSLERMSKRIKDLEAQKTPDRRPVDNRPEPEPDKTPKNPVKGGRTK